jgi:hypothetical protein
MFLLRRGLGRFPEALLGLSMAWGHLAAAQTSTLDSRRAGVAASGFVTADDIKTVCDIAALEKYQNEEPNSRHHVLAEFCRQSPTTWSGLRLTQASTPEIPDIALVESVSVAGTGERYASLARTYPGALRSFGSSVIPDQGVILLGFTEFVVGRAKEEVATYIVNRFASQLCPESFTITWPKDNGQATLRDSVGSFIPATCNLLQSASGDELLGSGSGLPSWGVLQTTLRADADGLPDTVLVRFQTFGSRVYAGALVGDFKPQRKDAAQRLTALVGVARLGRSFMSRSDFPVAFREAANDIVVTVKSFCRAAYDSPERRCVFDWASVPVIRNMLVAGAIAGAVPSAELRKTIPIDSSLTLTLKAFAVNLQPGQSDTNPVLASALQHFLKEIGPKKEGSEIPFDVQAWLARAKPLVTTLISAETDAANKASQAGLSRPQRLAIYADALVEISPELIRGADPNADSRISEQATILAKRLGSYAGLRIRGAYAPLVADLMTLGSLVAAGYAFEELRQATFPAPVVRAVQFVVDASQVKDADAFAGVLGNYAAPVSAFQKKRLGAWRGYWTFNTYVGVAYGRETAEGANIPTGPETAAYHGFSIPVGFEFGTSTGYGTVGLLVQLADVGQVASWRTKQGKSDVKTTPPGLTFASVFAPGINLVFNCPKLPVAVGAGYSRVPQFRDLTTTTDPARPKADVHRWVIFTGVDVPIFP